jgi:hypothetical protein
MIPVKRPRRATLQTNPCKEVDKNTVCSELNSGVPLKTLIEYFLHISHISGIYDDMNVFSEAWTITIRVLLSAGVLNLAEYVFDDQHETVASFPRKFKAVVVAACALAVDACGDFEASYAHAAFAWATLFMNQIQGTDALRTTDSDCCQLMRMKMIAGRALRWDIGVDNPVNSFYSYIRKLRECFSCDCCQRLLEVTTVRFELVLQSLSFVLLPKGQSCDIIALSSIAYLHNQTEQKQIPTPMGRCRVTILPSCLDPLFQNSESVRLVYDCLEIIGQNSNYLNFLIKETNRLRTSRPEETLATIEREYIHESTTDTQSSA